MSESKNVLRVRYDVPHALSGKGMQRPGRKKERQVMTLAGFGKEPSPVPAEETNGKIRMARVN